MKLAKITKSVNYRTSFNAMNMLKTGRFSDLLKEPLPYPIRNGYNTDEAMNCKEVGYPV